MVKIIAVMSGKGGVGKTSISVMLSKILSETSKTILLDFDLCGPSVYRALNLNGSLVKDDNGFVPIKVDENLSALSFGAMLKEKDAVIWRGAKKLIFLDLFYKSIMGYDYVVIDTPPGISEEHEFLVDKNIKSIVITTPQNISLSDAQRCIEFCINKRVDIIGLLVNMSGIKCKCCGEIQYPFGKNGAKELAEEYNLNYCGELELEPRINQILDSGNFMEDFVNTETYLSLKKIIFDFINNLD